MKEKLLNNKKMSKEETNPALWQTDLLTDEAIEEYAFEKYHDVEDSRWFEPLQVGAKWSRDILIAEIQRLQVMTKNKFIKLLTGKIVKEEKGSWGTIHYRFIWATGDYKKDSETFDSEIQALEYLYNQIFSP